MIDIQRPIWGGGQPKIGVADFRLGGNTIDVRIGYTRKDGTKSYPGIYRMLASKLRTYPTQIVGSGVLLYVAPIADWEHLDEADLR